MLIISKVIFADVLKTFNSHPSLQSLVCFGAEPVLSPGEVVFLHSHQPKKIFIIAVVDSIFVLVTQNVMTKTVIWGLWFITSTSPQQGICPTIRFLILT